MGLLSGVLIAVLVVCFIPPPLACHESTVVAHAPKRDSSQGLFAFPRIGRAWPGADNELYKNHFHPRPRTGRTGGKRNGAGAASGLWFGPRLGRIEKRTPLVAWPWTCYYEDSFPADPVFNDGTEQDSFEDYEAPINSQFQNRHA